MNFLFVESPFEYLRRHLKNSAIKSFMLELMLNSDSSLCHYLRSNFKV